MEIGIKIGVNKNDSVTDAIDREVTIASRNRKKYGRRGLYFFFPLLALLVAEFIWGFETLSTLWQVALGVAQIVLVIGLVVYWVKEAKASGELRGLVKAMGLVVILGEREEAFDRCEKGVAGEDLRKGDMVYKKVPVRGAQGTVGFPSNPDFKKRRGELELTQAQVAKKAKVSISTVRNIEKDWKAVGLGSVQKVAGVLGWDMQGLKFGFQKK